MSDPINTAGHGAPAPSRVWRRVFAAAAVLLCILIPAARLTGPSDLHDQSQELTSAYTTDIAVHGSDWRRWMLPMHQGSHPATKPPLYNWMAAPVVWLTGGRAEWPHHLPSLLAFVALGVLLWRLGDWLDPRGLTGPLAVIIFASNYAWFKLSVLVRPDTLLSLWLALGWVGVTIVLRSGTSAQSRSIWRGVIWVACAMAALTKGPPALIIPLFAAVLGSFSPRTQRPAHQPGRRGLAGVWQTLARSGLALRECGALWGLPLVLAVISLWLALVWRIDPDHLYNGLIRAEFLDRVTGAGTEGVREGPWDLVRTALNMPLYFIMRFLPWSILFFGSLIDLSTDRRDALRAGVANVQHDVPDGGGPRWWMLSGVVYAGLIILVFSLAAGKRADYIASAYVSASLVVAWCLTHLGWRLAVTRPALVLAGAAVTVAAIITNERTNGYAVHHPLSDALWSFAAEVRPAIEAQPHPLEFFHTGAAPMQVMLQRSQPVLAEADLATSIESNPATWLIVGHAGLEHVLPLAAEKGWTLDLRAQSKSVQGIIGAAPVELRLYLVTPNK